MQHAQKIWRSSDTHFLSNVSGQTDKKTDILIAILRNPTMQSKNEITRKLTRRCFVESQYLRPRGAIYRVEKTGKQIVGWVQMSRNYVFHGGTKYIILSLSGRGMSLV